MDLAARRRQWYAMRTRLRDAGLWKGRVTDDIQQDIRKYGTTTQKKTQNKRAHADVDPEPEDDPEEGTSAVAGKKYMFVFCFSEKMSTLLILVKRVTTDEDEYNCWVKDVHTLIRGRWSCSATPYQNQETNQNGWFFRFYGFKVSAPTGTAALGDLAQKCIVSRGGEDSNPDDLVDYALAQSRWNVPSVVTKKKEETSEEESSTEETPQKKKKKMKWPGRSPFGDKGGSKHRI